MLTDKKKLFVKSYIKHGNATKAALDAGCPERSARIRGYELRRDPDVIEYIAELSKQIDGDTIATLKEVKERLTAIIRDGEENSYAVIKAIERLSKMSGWEAPVQSALSVSGKIEHQQYDLTKLSSDELRQYLELSSKCVQLIECDDGKYRPEGDVEELLKTEVTEENGDSDSTSD